MGREVAVTVVGLQKSRQNDCSSSATTLKQFSSHASISKQKIKFNNLYATKESYIIRERVGVIP